jgi:hypothetical protein
MENAEKVVGQPDKHGDMIGNFNRLGLLVGITVLIEFGMLLVSFFVGHYLGRQTVPQAIHVEAPIVKAQNDFVIDTQLAIREEQKQPAQFKVSLSSNGNGQTVTQEQVERLEKSLESMKVQINSVADGVKSSVHAETKPGEKLSHPVRISLESPAIKTKMEPPNAPAAPQAPKVEPKPTEHKSSQAEMPILKVKSFNEKMAELVDSAKTYCTNYEKTFGADLRKQFDKQMDIGLQTRLADQPTADENAFVNDKLIGKLLSLKDKKKTGQTADQKEVYETCVLICKYTKPNMQLPGPVLDILKSPDERDFQEAVGFLRVAKLE